MEGNQRICQRLEISHEHCFKVRPRFFYSEASEFQSLRDDPESDWDILILLDEKTYEVQFDLYSVLLDSLFFMQISSC